ncbi:hypothetical protein [Paenibacillus glycanilyticus]|uniref:hypothetical protein n=1 Tax=Paenibacillus glycanilyticus TaxID=126569 RepID=UPI00191107D9|nr:hypothetical protein [Paenibacillus glycanilyticus]
MDRPYPFFELSLSATLKRKSRRGMRRLIIIPFQEPGESAERELEAEERERPPLFLNLDTYNQIQEIQKQQRPKPKLSRSATLRLNQS